MSRHDTDTFTYTPQPITLVRTSLMLARASVQNPSKDMHGTYFRAVIPELLFETAAQYEQMECADPADIDFAAARLAGFAHWMAKWISLQADSAVVCGMLDLFEHILTAGARRTARPSATTAMQYVVDAEHENTIESLRHGDHDVDPYLFGSERIRQRLRGRIAADLVAKGPESIAEIREIWGFALEEFEPLPADENSIMDLAAWLVHQAEV